MTPGDLVEIFADNSYGGFGLVLESRDMYILVRGADGRQLWYSRNEIAHPLATHINCEWATEQ
jgi:hypothetical protein